MCETWISQGLSSSCSFSSSCSRRQVTASAAALSCCFLVLASPFLSGVEETRHPQPRWRQVSAAAGGEEEEEEEEEETTELRDGHSTANVGDLFATCEDIRFLDVGGRHINGSYILEGDGGSSSSSSDGKDGSDRDHCSVRVYVIERPTESAPVHHTDGPVVRFDLWS